MTYDIHYDIFIFTVFLRINNKHLIFSILFNCSPPTNVVVSPSTLADWDILLREANKLILCKNLQVANLTSM